VKEAEDNWNFWSWFSFQFKPEYPDYIGEYQGMDWAQLESLGGWGDFTIQTMENPYYIYPFGVMGGYSDLSEDNFIARDINSENCAPRYSVLMIYVRDTQQTIPADSIEYQGTVQALA